MADLPVPFTLGEPKMPVDQLERPFRRLDHRDLRPPRLAPVHPERDLVSARQRPSGEDEVAIPTPRLEVDVHLVERRGRIQRVEEPLGLVVVPGSSYVA